jgi:hypothetical protein
MKKIASLFQRNYDGDRKVRDEVVPGSEWVAAGEGVATRKWDGMAVLVKDGAPFMRYDAKHGKTPPENFVPAQPAADEKTGHWPGWVPAEGSNAKRVLEGIEWGKRQLFNGSDVPDGTYEVCGPTIGTRHGPNPENLTETILVPHGRDTLPDCPRTYDALRSYLKDREIEGVVWHRDNGDMVKIKKSDFPFEPAA